MRKKDEIELWNKVKNKKGIIEWERIGQRLGIQQKRLFYILEKWSDKGIINYGVSIRYAWIEGELK